MRRRSWPRATAVFAFAVLTAPRLVLAQSQEAIEEGRALFDEGRRAYEDGEFETALRSFERVYELTAQPELLYNIATVADRLRRDELAIESYRRYLDAVPETEARARIEARIATLERALERPAQERKPANVPQSAELPSANPKARTPMPRDQGGDDRLLTWIALGGAAIFGAAAGLFWLFANNEHDDFAQRCTMGCPADLIDDSPGPLYVTLTNVALIASGATLTAAIVLFFVEPGPGGAAGADLAFGFGPGSLSMRTSF